MLHHPLLGRTIDGWIDVDLNKLFIELIRRYFMNEMTSGLLVPEVCSESGGNLSEEGLTVGFGLVLKD